MTTVLSFAQKVTNENLQGTWEVAALDALNSQGIYLDVEKNDVNFSEQIKAQATPEQLAEAKQGLAPTLEMFKEMRMVINRNEIKQSMPGQEETGVFTLESEKEKQMLKIVYTDGIEDFVEVYFKDGKLYIDLREDGLFIYKKS